MIQPARKPRISTSQNTNSASPVVMRLPPRAATWTPTDGRFYIVAIRHERQENSMLYRDLWTTAYRRRWLRLRRILRIGRTEQRQGDDSGGEDGGKHAVCMVTKDMLG